MIIRFLITALLLTGVAAAQRGGGGGGGKNSGMNIPNVGPSRPNRLEMLSQFLSLSKDQKKDIKTLMDDGQKEAAPLRDQLSKARAQIGAAIQAGKTQDEVNQAIKAYSDLQAQMAVIELRAFAGIVKDLDSAQQQQASRVYPMMNGIFKGKNWMEAE